MKPLPRIFPLTKKVSRKTFFLFIFFLDILTQGIGGIICGGLALIIYCIKKNFDFIYFNIFSYGRFFIDVVIMSLIIYFFFRFLEGKNDLFDYLGISNPTFIYFLYFFLSFYYIWNIYLSFNFILQVKFYQEEFLVLKEQEKEKNMGLNN